MVIHRAIEFSKLTFLADEAGIQVWTNCETQFNNKNSNNSGANWWLENTFERQRRLITSQICRNSSEAFFSTSCEYNAMQGGRFNPSKSFGMLYCATSPIIACFEVLYHIFDQAFPLYKQMDRSGARITSTFNVSIPKSIKVLITVFEIEIDSYDRLNTVCDCVSELKSDCERIGFIRYIGDNFTRDFIFGNDYEISRILGCHLHTKEIGSFTVPSARLSFDEQDSLEHRNIIIPEKEFKIFNPRLTGKFREYMCKIDLESRQDLGGHVVEIYPTSNYNLNVKLLLQQTPNKRVNPQQFITYSPNTGSEKERRIYSREVSTQKFVEMPEVSEMTTVEAMPANEFVLS